MRVTRGSRVRIGHVRWIAIRMGIVWMGCAGVIDHGRESSVKS